MIDNFECEQTVIKQYIYLQLQKCLTEKSHSNILELPYQIYLFCHQIFKKEQNINSYLFEFYGRVFYLPRLEDVHKDCED